MSRSVLSGDTEGGSRWRFRLWLATTVVYWCGLAVLMHLPPAPKGPPGWFDFPHADKVAHGVLYGTLAVLLSFTVRAYRSNRVGDVRSTSRLAAVRTLAVIGLYGLFDELTQPLTGRTCDVWDWGADVVAAAVGVAIVFALRGADEASTRA